MLLSGKLVELKIIILSKKSLSQRIKYCIFSLVLASKNKEEMTGNYKVDLEIRKEMERKKEQVGMKIIKVCHACSKIAK